jgi:CHAT domain-containing protein/tetratricopeptide (TPR) repeat protein
MDGTAFSTRFFARLQHVRARIVKPSYAIASLTMVLSVVQCGTRTASNPRIQGNDDEPPELRELRRQGNALLRGSQYPQAISIYENGYREARRRRSLRSAVRFLNNLGSVYYQLFRYRDAIQTYLKARDLARLEGDREMLGALSVNLSSLYFDMGEIDAALESAEEGLKLPSDATARFKAQLLLQCARIKERQKDTRQRVALLQNAIEVSRTELDMASEAQAWNELGNAFVECGQLQSGERALLEAFRMRKLTHDDRIYFSYESLGHLRALQGDLQSASMFLDRAVDSARFVNPSAIWSAYYERGKLKLAKTQLQEAFTDFGNALDCVRRWRAEVLPADAFRISSEVELQQVYSSYIEAGSRLYKLTRRKRFAEETFAVAEESRAASLRALWAGSDLTKKFPNEYWEALADLYKAEGALVKGEPDGDATLIRRLRLRVAEMETRAGLDLPRDLGNLDPNGGELLDRTRSALGPTEVFIGFHLGDVESCVWVIGREGFEFRRLPPRARIAENIRLFVNAVRDSSSEVMTLGNRLYSQLFASSSRRLLNKPQWIVAPDGPLFDMPFAALVEASKSPEPGSVHFVVERHAVRIVPGISALFGVSNSDWNGPVVGLGDPIYNRADPRFPSRRAPGNGYDNGHRGSSSPVPRLELARLVGSGREIESCARIWRSQGLKPILLEGGSANKENLSEALRRNPAVLHLAAHILFPAQYSGLGLVALALQPEGEMELLSATEIASMRVKIGLVILNGCNSAHASILPGAGLMGLTRAWLAAGASAVIVTRWAMPDQDDGQLFASFYERLHAFEGFRDRKSFAQVLQQAQLSELHAGGRRAKPAYWAAYFCVERN